MHVAALVIGVLLFGSQVVLSTTFKFKFSTVEQCQPVTLTLFGDTSPNDLPTTLTILPLNAQPISIPIPNAMVNTSSIAVSFLPLPVNTTFVATLDNAGGFSAAWVSDIIRVLPSPTGNTACLPAAPISNQQTFVITNEPSQCEQMTVNYDTTRVTSAPAVRLFSPLGPAFPLNLTSNDPAHGIADYLVNFFRGKQVVLLFDGGPGNQETSDLITIFGDSTSSGKCIFDALQGNALPPVTTKSSANGLSRDVIIGLSVGGAAVGLIAICMIFYILRERRRQKVQISFDPAMLEKKPEQDGFVYQPYLGSIPRPPVRESFIQDPPYTAQSFGNNINARRTSTSSWSQVLPADHQFDIRNKEPPPTSSTRLSLNSLDIEGMLNIAAIHSNRSSRQEPAPLGPVQQVPPLPPAQALLRPVPGRLRDQDPFDVPRGPTSMMSISSNPFSDDNMVPPRPMLVRLPANPSPRRQPSPAMTSSPVVNNSRSGSAVDPILSSPNGRYSSNFGVAQ